MAFPLGRDDALTDHLGLAYEDYRRVCYFMSDTMMLGVGGGSAYPITNSLLFRGAQSLSRTPSVAGNRKTGTLRMPVRFGSGNNYCLLWAGPTNGTTETFISLNGSDQIAIIARSGGSVIWDAATTPVARDPGWYMLTVAWDTTQATAADRFKVFVDNRQWAVTFSTQITQNTDTQFFSTNEHRIGARGASLYLNGYLAEPILVDGAALTPSSFGETDLVTLNWRPKTVALTGSLPVYTSAAISSATASAGFSTTGSVPGLFNGNTADEVVYPTYADNTGKTMTFDLGSAKALTRGRMWVNGSSGEGNWKWQGSADGATGWTDVGAAFALTGGAPFEFTTLSANTTPYRYWRLIGTGGTPNTGYWREIQLEATTSTTAYGTNGGYLGKPWNSASLGTDYSGQGNNWTPSGFVSTDVVSDSPTNVYATMDPVDKAVSPGTLRYGNLNVYVASGPSYDNFRATMAPTMPIYFEFFYNTSGGVENYIGMVDAASALSSSARPANFYSVMYSGNKWSNSGGSVALGSGYVAADSTNGRGMCAFDPTTGKLWFGRGGAWFGSGDPATGANPAFTLSTTTLFVPHVVSGYTLDLDMNFGQRSFTYTPPTGFKSLCTSNLPAPSAAAKQPWKYYHQSLVVHDGISTAFTLGWNPDPANGGSHTLFRIKNLAAGASWFYFDTARGLDKYLREDTVAEGTASGAVTAASSGVVTLSSAWSAQTMLVEAWRVSPESGFDIVTYTGTGVARTVTHNNGRKPGFLVGFNRTTTAGHIVYHQSLGATKYMFLDSTGAPFTDATGWNNVEPTATDITLGNTFQVNQSGASHVLYVWSEVPGFSKFDSFSGNASADGPFLYRGFVVGGETSKRTDTGGYPWTNWTQAQNTYNPAGRVMRLNENSSEAAVSPYYSDLLSSGRKLRGSEQGTNNGTLVNAAFSRRCIGGQGVSPALAA